MDSETFISTRHIWPKDCEQKVPTKFFSEAVIEGLASDGGLCSWEGVSKVKLWGVEKPGRATYIERAQILGNVYILLTYLLPGWRDDWNCLWGNFACSKIALSGTCQATSSSWSCFMDQRDHLKICLYSSCPIFLHTVFHQVAILWYL